MSSEEEFIKSKITIGSNTSSNGWRRKGVFIPSYSLPWLTPDDARKAVEIAREEVIDKAIGWIKEINNHHHIMRYSDSCEPPISELTEWFKNYMKEGGKDE